MRASHSSVGAATSSYILSTVMRAPDLIGGQNNSVFFNNLLGGAGPTIGGGSAI